MLQFTRINPQIHPRWDLDTIVGILPYFFNKLDARSAQDQLANSPGGPWSNYPSKWKFDPKDNSIKYPGDPKLLPLARASLHNQTILVYESAWVVILEADGSWEIDRRD